MKYHRFNRPLFFALAFSLLAGITSISHASFEVPTVYVPSVCEGQSGTAFGVCRAAVASGCKSTTNAILIQGKHNSQSPGHAIANSDSRFCKRLSTEFTKLTGLNPVWVKKNLAEQ